MISLAFASLVGCLSVFGFVASVRREADERATWLEWLLGAGLGVLFGASTFALL